MSMTDVAQAREIQVFAKKETVFGTAVVPAASNAVFVLDSPGLSNLREVIEDRQKRTGASETNHFLGRYNASEWSFSTYVKPSGSAGTAPQHDVLWECALGTKTVVGSTSVTYTLADTLSSFTLWVLYDHTMMMIPGCTVNNAEIVVNGTEYAMVNWSGMGLQRLWAGTGTLASTTSTGTSIPLSSGHGVRFSVGAYIKVGTDDNSAAGYRITAISTDTLTITPTLAGGGASAGADVGPLVPSAMTEVGDPVLGKLGAMTKGGTSMDILSGSVSLNNNLKYYNEEKNNSLYPTEMGRPGKRMVSVSLNMYLRKETAQFWSNQLAATEVAIVLPAGSTAGSICTISVPKTIFNNPDVSGDEESTMAIEGGAIASSSLNDELSVAFT